MNKLKRGDKIQIIRDTCSHNYKIGHIGVFYCYDSEKLQSINIDGIRDTYVSKNDYKIISQSTEIGFWA